MAYENTLTLLKESKLSGQKKAEFLKAIIDDSEKINISNNDAKLLKELSQDLQVDDPGEDTEDNTQKKIPTIAEMAEKARIIK